VKGATCAEAREEVQPRVSAGGGRADEDLLECGRLGAGTASTVQVVARMPTSFFRHEEIESSDDLSSMDGSGLEVPPPPPSSDCVSGRLFLDELHSCSAGLRFASRLPVCNHHPRSSRYNQRTVVCPLSSVSLRGSRHRSLILIWNRPRLGFRAPTVDLVCERPAIRGPAGL
jgi:hypothetical protein